MFLDIASPLISKGICVVPTKPGLRFPTLEDWPERATTDFMQCNLWNMENPNSNCCCVAKRDGVAMYDIDDIEACKKMGMPSLPATFTVKSPKGYHGYFKHTQETEELGNRIVRDDKGKCVFELKCHNLACCAPGCTRDDGGKYEVQDNLPIVEGLPVALRKWIELNSKTVHSATDRTPRKFHPEFDEQHLFDYYKWDFAEDFTKGGAHYFVFRECPIKGAAHDDQVRSKKTCLILGDSIGFDCKVCGDSYGWKELLDHMEKEGIPKYDYMIFADQDDDILLEGIAPCADELEDATAVNEVDTTGYEYAMTDTGNAERLVRKFGNRIKYVNDIGVWRVWDGKLWRTDHRNTVDRMAKLVVKELATWASEGDETESKERYKWVKVSGGRERRNAMIALAALEKDIVSRSTDYDNNNWQFNLQNGTIDLKTGKLLPHNPHNMCSKISPVIFDQTAACPLFDKFLAEVQDDEPTRKFMQQATGYTLSGNCDEQVFFFLYGIGANGKSVFSQVIRHLLGTYAKIASFDTFIVKKNDNGPKNDLAALVGARLVQCAESTEGQVLNSELIKAITGGEEITVRFLHKEFFSYLPKFKIWMSSNNEPTIRGTDWGIWRRVREIPFDTTIMNPDKNLAIKLFREMPGILNWALAGLREFNATGGLVETERVKEATRIYRESQDIVGQFIGARCVLRPDQKIKAMELYAGYIVWAEATRERVMTERAFSKRLLKVAGISKEHKKDGNWYFGVGQVSSGPNVTDLDEIDQDSVI